MKQDPTLQPIAEQLVMMLTAQQGKLFGREVIVSEAARGEIEVTASRLILHPFYLVQGNPIANVLRALKLCDEYDSERQKATRRILDSLKHRLRVTVRELAVLDPEATLRILREELGEDVVETLHIELL